MSKEIDLEKEDWQGGQYETEKVKVDATIADGRPIILRRFQAKFRPDIEKFPTEKEIAEDHIGLIESLWLWKDELVLIEPLRVSITIGGGR